MRRSHSKDYGPVQGVVMVQLKDVINTMKDKFQRTRVSEEVRTEGQALVLDVEGTGRELTGVVNNSAAKHLKVRSIAKILRILSMEWWLDYERWWWKIKYGQLQSSTAVARGDLTQKIEIPFEDEMSRDVNPTVDQLSAFAFEVTRVVWKSGRRVYWEVKQKSKSSWDGGQARFTNVSGTWNDLTDNVNLMANNLTLQARTIAVFMYNWRYEIGIRLLDQDTIHIPR
ncbi:hypothetical protein BYT27DRAFT_7253627 [Phlegmacium glaucopus]|nr:hypothetical protein BYT27DRAFT_7253627 [Phlegmacium glaucopus]